MDNQTMRGSRGGDCDSGPWKITSSMGFYRNLYVDPPGNVGLPGKSWTPLEHVGPPLKTWKMIVFFEIKH